MQYQQVKVETQNYKKSYPTVLAMELLLFQATFNVLNRLAV